MKTYYCNLYFVLKNLKLLKCTKTNLDTFVVVLMFMKETELKFSV